MSRPLLSSSLLIVLLLTGAGCALPSEQANTSVTEDPVSVLADLTSDFTPYAGATDGPGEFGPWNNRLMSAISEDGINWAKTNEIVSDRADVPDLTIVDGVIYLYYTGWTVGHYDNHTVVALSDDKGESWTYKFVNVDGAEGLSALVDPDIQYIDEVFRLYLTADPLDGDGPRTYLTESEDGINFTIVGEAFARPGERVLDPNTILIGDTWHYFAGGGPGGNWHATSSDGITFEYNGSEDFMEDGMTYMMANGIQMGETYRYWAFSNHHSDTVSFVTTDGYNWEFEGVALSLDQDSPLESTHVKDATVIQLDDGSYYMVYVTHIP